MREIQLTRGYVTQVDDEDYESLCRFTWRVLTYSGRGWQTFYAIRNVGGGRTALMHRQIMAPATKLVVDHADGDGLNNQRANLRVCTLSQNSANRRRVLAASGLKGVTFVRDRRTLPWRADIRVAGKQISLGFFASSDAAASAYDGAANSYFGPFAATNSALGLRAE